MFRPGTAQHIWAYVSFTDCTDAYILGHVSLLMSSLWSTEHTWMSVLSCLSRLIQTYSLIYQNLHSWPQNCFSIIPCRIRNRLIVSNISFISQNKKSYKCFKFHLVTQRHYKKQKITYLPNNNTEHFDVWSRSMANT